MIAGACVAFAVVNGLVWWQKREARQNGAFALLAAGAALLTLIELELLASTTIERYAQWLGHYLLATSLMFVAIMLVCRYHVGAGRDIGLDGVPVLVLIADLFALRANREDALERLDLLLRGLGAPARGHHIGAATQQIGRASCRERVFRTV